MAELVVARNPDPGSSLGFLLWIPLGDGLLFRTSGTWPRTTALYCHPADLDEWPAGDDLEIVERVALRSCARRGAAVDVVLDRARENRSQIVYTRGRGRDMVFWQSPRTRKQARPQVRTPSARPAALDGTGADEIEIVVDAHERYPYRFASQQTRTVRRALPAGDYGVVLGDTLVASVERKSLPDLISSVANGRLRFALGELSALPRAAVVVEDRWSQVFAQRRVRPAQVADSLAELQVRWPDVPIVFAETRPLAEEWTFRYLAAALAWALDEHAVGARVPGATTELTVPMAPGPSTAEVRAWARGAGIEVPDRGRLRPEVWAQFREARGTVSGGP
ncbi:ERCC4 domain-containing protein [Actinomycetospora chibensis]|uniref:ERCC4 domain-containing protein n=1 Tax=Actinomycetospora chibensis TaxID=663606 RepID=A0ABV9RII5_9PSEU|nr:ERCC4 domain-containing protein [Actinomycetospora chibensis]MDD7926863.1 ERCC4 domain-containing protein [Actinomycetospora chibensis]